jgi:hypothetical protein
MLSRMDFKAHPCNGIHARGAIEASLDVSQAS